MIVNRQIDRTMSWSVKLAAALVGLVVLPVSAQVDVNGTKEKTPDVISNVPAGLADAQENAPARAEQTSINIDSHAAVHDDLVEDKTESKASATPSPAGAKYRTGQLATWGEGDWEPNPNLERRISELENVVRELAEMIKAQKGSHFSSDAAAAPASQLPAWPKPTLKARQYAPAARPAPPAKPAPALSRHFDLQTPRTPRAPKYADDRPSFESSASPEAEILATEQQQRKLKSMIQKQLLEIEKMKLEIGYLEQEYKELEANKERLMQQVKMQ